MISVALQLINSAPVSIFDKITCKTINSFKSAIKKVEKISATNKTPENYQNHMDLLRVFQSYRKNYEYQTDKKQYLKVLMMAKLFLNKQAKLPKIVKEKAPRKPRAPKKPKEEAIEEQFEDEQLEQKISELEALLTQDIENIKVQLMVKAIEDADNEVLVAKEPIVEEIYCEIRGKIQEIIYPKHPTAYQISKEIQSKNIFEASKTPKIQEKAKEEIKDEFTVVEAPEIVSQRPIRKFRTSKKVIDNVEAQLDNQIEKIETSIQQTLSVEEVKIYNEIAEKIDEAEEEKLIPQIIEKIDDELYTLTLEEAERIAEERAILAQEAGYGYDYAYKFAYIGVCDTFEASEIIISAEQIEEISHRFAQKYFGIVENIDQAFEQALEDLIEESEEIIEEFVEEEEIVMQGSSEISGSEMSQIIPENGQGSDNSEPQVKIIRKQLNKYGDQPNNDSDSDSDSDSGDDSDNNSESESENQFEDSDDFSEDNSSNNSDNDSDFDNSDFSDDEPPKKVAKKQQIEAQIIEEFVSEEEITRQGSSQTEYSEGFSENNQIEAEIEVDSEDDIIIEESDKNCIQTFQNALKQYQSTTVCGKRQNQYLNLKSIPTQINNLRREILYSIDQLSIFDAFYRNEQWSKIQKQFAEIIKPIHNMQIWYRFVVFGDNTFEIISTKVGRSKDTQNQIVSILKQLSEKYADSTIQGVKIMIYPQFSKFNKGEMVRGGQKIISMNNKYLLISPSSYTNCFYHCLVYYKLLIEGKFDKITGDNEYIEQTAKDIKRKYTSNTKDHSDLTDIQEISNYYNINFMIYNNLFNIENEIKPVKQNNAKKTSILLDQTIKLQFRNGHCLLMVPKNKYPEFAQDYQKIQEKQNIECKPIQIKNFKQQPKNRQIWSYDLECLKINDLGTQKPFAAGLCTMFNISRLNAIDGSEFNYKSFWGDDCITQLLNYLAEYNMFVTIKKQQGKKDKKVQNEVYMYAHNGAKYDIAIINEYLLKRSDLLILSEKFMELNGGVINMEIVNKNGVKFIFRDSCRIFNGSLGDLCKQLKPKYAKLTEHTFKFEDLNSNNIYDKYYDEIYEYLKHDCLSLAQIMNQFRKQLIEDKKIGIDICDCFTSATLAKKLYFKQYYPRVVNKLNSQGTVVKQHIYELNREIDLDIRDGYFGGRCDMYHYGTFKKVNYYDFTSLYPAVGAKEQMPIDCPIKVEGKDIDINNFFGFIRCLVTTNTDNLPLHGIKHDSRLVFANHQTTNIMLFSEEIKQGILKGNSYEFLYGYQFNQAMVLKDLMKEGFQRKAQAKKDGQPILEATWKVTINSGYGFWGLRWMDKRGLKLMNQQQLGSCIENGQVFNYNQINEDQYMVDLENDLIEIQGKNIAVAAAVTSYARMWLYRLMIDIMEKGYKVLYSDTDSIITDCNLQEHTDLKLKYQWDGCGDALGSLKNECLDKIKKTIAKQLDSKNNVIRAILYKFIKPITQYIVDKQIEHDGGELYFDEAQILGPKVYSLKKTLINGQVMEIAKMKGCQKSSYDEQTKLLEGAIIGKSVTQFVSGKRCYMKDQEIEGRVNVINVNKTITLFKKDGSVKYSKGIIQGSEVKPFLFVNGILQNQ